VLSASCWKELSVFNRTNLVPALKTAFVADVSPEISQALLNLAEFMEHDEGGGLPIEIDVLAELALKCRAYAIKLYYKEREYATGKSSSCVESLIRIYGKLGCFLLSQFASGRRRNRCRSVSQGPKCHLELLQN
jgi:serine/threonine-protein kinase mTOR